jgi:hypothetical protein
LTGNETVLVSENAFKQVGDKLLRVDFSNNKLVCNCSMQWFHVWFVNHREVFVGDDDLYNCSNLNGINMQTWVVSQQECLFHFMLLFVASFMLLTGLLTTLVCLKKQRSPHCPGMSKEHRSSHCSAEEQRMSTGASSSHSTGAYPELLLAAVVSPSTAS